MHEPVDEQLGHLHEKPEVGNPGDHAVELVAEMLLHVLALEPGLDLACPLLGAFLVSGCDRAEAFHVFSAVAEAPGFAAVDDMPDCAVHKEIGIAPDG